jgi:hypothetical protein
MSNSEEIREHALRLADEGMEPGQAAALLLGDSPRRVPVVAAKRSLEIDLTERGCGSSAAKALEIVNLMLAEGAWAD